MYKIRIILDSEEDVIRTLVVNHTIDLETLHQSIAKSFGFDGSEMASFYLSNNNWDQGQEIPLFNMSEAGEGVSMATTLLEAAMKSTGDKMIYVYDFFSMWTFYVELIDTDIELENRENSELPKTILAVGEIPEKAPEKEFTTEKNDSEFDDELNDDFESFEDFDFNNY